MNPYVRPLATRGVMRLRTALHPWRDSADIPALSGAKRLTPCR